MFRWFWPASAGFLLLYATAVFGVASNYETAVARVLDHEGRVYENHPSDPGGPTKFGITIYDVRLYIKRGATAADVRRLTEDQALDIYNQKYWHHDCVKGDELPAGVDYSVFDYGVNSGVGRSGKVLRKVLGFSTESCNVTDDVIAKANKVNSKKLIVAINEERMHFLRGLRTFGVFGRGWTRRVNEVRSASLRMADGVEPQGLADSPAEYAPGKAYDARPDPFGPDSEPEEGTP